jgi:hypothetical protein
VKFGNKEENWHSLQPLGVQYEDCTVCNSVLDVCEVQRVDQVLKRELTTPEEPEEEAAEDKTTFLDALKELDAARKCMYQFDTEDNIILTCNKLENELHRLRTGRRDTLVDWLKK